MSAAVLAFLVRGRGRVFWWTLVAALAMVAVQVLWWTLVRPVNDVMAGWTSPASIPSDWESLRARWEYTHAVRAVIQTCGLAALMMSFLTEIDDLERTRSVEAGP